MRVVVVARDNVLVVPCDELEVVNVVYAERKGVKRDSQMPHRNESPTSRSVGNVKQSVSTR